MNLWNKLKICKNVLKSKNCSSITEQKHGEFIIDGVHDVERAKFFSSMLLFIADKMSEKEDNGNVIQFKKRGL